MHPLIAELSKLYHTHRMRCLVALSIVVLLPTSHRAGAAVDIPTSAGTTYVIAVANAPSTEASAIRDVATGDYETIVTITAADAKGLELKAFIDAADASGTRKQVAISRRVLGEDLLNSHVQILGFHSTDPPVVNGTTAMGPSLAVVRELQAAGTSAYSFRNFASLEAINGTLALAEPKHVKFPVLINGQRVELDAMRATAMMKSGTAARPFEQIMLPHPTHPLSLRIAYGPRNGGFPFKPDFAREIVRIDFPTSRPPLEAALEKECRAEIPGVYFDFNQATLKSASMRSLQDISTTLKKHPQWQISIEGHTDNIGGEGYNDDLSRRRAAAVKSALTGELAVDGTRLATKGWGLRKPVESNDTLAGRARNRRVELVRECG